MIFINLENLQGKKSDKFNKLTEMKKYKLPFLLAVFSYKLAERFFYKNVVINPW